MDDHLTGCATCRQRLEAALPASVPTFYAELQRAAEPLAEAHPAFAQLASLLDETLAVADQQFVTDHAASCAQCAQTLADLRTFRAEPAAIPARPVTAPVESWREKLRALVWPSTPALGWGLAALLLLALTGWWLRAALQPQSATQLAGPTASPSAAPAPAFEPPTATPGALPTTAPTIAPTNAPLLARLNDASGEITLDQQSRLSGLEALPASYQQLVRNALTKQQIAPPATLAELNRRGSSLMGADESGQRFSLTAPVGQVVQADRPAFRWTALAGANSYVVEVYDQQFNLVAQSVELTGTSWTPAQPLARGQVFAWQVKARKEGQEIQAPKPPAAQARFRVLDQTQANELARARRAYGNAHLALGVLYAQAGLLDEAARELRILQRANPDSALARKLAASVAAQRR